MFSRLPRKVRELANSRWQVRMVAVAAVSLVTRAAADEGMWTFDQFPANLVRAKYGVEITSAWLAGVQASTLRLATCTASFVSPSCLILTNHHCVKECLTEHSSPTHRAGVERAHTNISAAGKAHLSFSLERMRERPGPNNALVRRVFDGASPDNLAAQLVDPSNLPTRCAFALVERRRGRDRSLG